LTFDLSLLTFSAQKIRHLKSKVLLHVAVIIDIVAVVIIFANRAAADYLPNGVTSPQNFPLAIIMVVIIFLAEFPFQKKASSFALVAFLMSVLLLLFCVQYLPPVSETATEEPSAFAYALLMAQLSMLIVVSFSRNPTVWKTAAFFIFLCAAFTLAAFIYTFSNQATFHRDSKADAAVVLGASVWGRRMPSPILRGRLEKAIEIFKSGDTKKLVATGGTKRFGTVESEVQAWYLRQNGVPDSNIIVEHGTFCTSEQAIFIKKILIDSLGLRNIVIVTDSWHLPRAMLMCHWQDIPRDRISGIASNYKMSTMSELYFRVRESVAIEAFILFGA